MIYPFHDLCRPDDSVIIIPTHWSCGMVLPGFLKLVSPKTKAGKTLLGPIKPNNPSVPMTYKGQSSFGITTILLYLSQAIRPANLYSCLLNPPIHLSECRIKARSFSESCTKHGSLGARTFYIWLSCIAMWYRSKDAYNQKNNENN